MDLLFMIAFLTTLCSSVGNDIESEKDQDVAIESALDYAGYDEQ